MYLGTTSIKEKRWGSRWHSMLGDLPVVIAIVDVVKHVYQCGKCGKTFRFPVQAPEPFYCSTDDCCQQQALVSIDPEELAPVTAELVE